MFDCCAAIAVGGDAAPATSSGLSTADFMLKYSSMPVFLAGEDRFAFPHFLQNSAETHDAGRAPMEPQALSPRGSPKPCHHHQHSQGWSTQLQDSSGSAASPPQTPRIAKAPAWDLPELSKDIRQSGATSVPLDVLLGQLKADHIPAVHCKHVRRGSDRDRYLSASVLQWAQRVHTPESTADPVWQWLADAETPHPEAIPAAA